MADLTIFQKYPLADEDQSGAKSMRIDHPDFGDVLRTVYAKGVITDFEKISDDPIQVKSRVKVTGNFGESEYIPIFYHPKKLFWDDPLADPPVLATDFDEETGVFKQAWQSFRGGDEVAVMLKEGVPVGVVGFADGVPRVGEAVFQMEYDTVGGASRIYQWQPSLPGPDAEGPGCPYETFDEENQGPDGLSLGLKTEALIVCDTGIGEREETTVDSTWWQRYPDFVDVENITTSTHKVQRRFMEYLVTIGPIAYIIQVLYQIIESTLTYSAEGVDVILAYPPWHQIITGSFPLTKTYFSQVSVFSKLYNNEVKEDAIALGATHESVNLVSSFLVRPAWCVRYNASGYIVPVNPSWIGNEYNYGYRGPAWTGWLLNPDWSVRLSRSYLNEYDNTSLDQLALGTLKIFTRPHTKAELQAAGMWPAGAS